jgi:hypothetical protein
VGAFDGDDSIQWQWQWTTTRHWQGGEGKEKTMQMQQSNWSNGIGGGMWQQWALAFNGSNGQGCLMVAAMEAAARQGWQRRLWESSSILQWAAADGGLVGCKEAVAATMAMAMLLH